MGTEEKQEETLVDALTAAYNAAEEAPVEAVETTPAGGDRPRDELGRFKASEEAPVETPPDGDTPEDPKLSESEKKEAADVPPVVPEQADPNKPAEGFRPPPGWSIAAKQAFNDLPAAVKEAIANREEEVNNGFAKLQKYKGLEQFEPVVEQSGRTLAEAFDNFYAAERFLEQNSVEGIKWLMGVYGVTPEQLGAATSVQRQHGVQPDPQNYREQQPALDPRYDQLAPQVEALLETVSAQRAEATRAMAQKALNVVQEFESNPENVYFQNVRKEMADIINAAVQSGKEVSIKEAYDRACWQNPEIRTELINKQVAADNQKREEEAKARASKAAAAAKSIAGVSEAVKTSQASPANEDLRESLARQMREAELA